MDFLMALSKVYFLFVHETLQMFQNVILKTERDDINSPEVSQAYSKLMMKFEDMKNHIFIPFAAKQQTESR